jgi:hypothetical protein
MNNLSNRYSELVEEVKRAFSYLDFEVVAETCADGEAVSMWATYSRTEQLCVTLFPDWMALVILSEEDSQAFQGYTVDEVREKLHLYLEGDISVGMPTASDIRVCGSCD